MTCIEEIYIDINDYSTKKYNQISLTGIELEREIIYTRKLMSYLRKDKPKLYLLYQNEISEEFVFVNNETNKWKTLKQRKKKRKWLSHKHRILSMYLQELKFRKLYNKNRLSYKYEKITKTITVIVGILGFLGVITSAIINKLWN